MPAEVQDKVLRSEKRGILLDGNNKDNQKFPIYFWPNVGKLWDFELDGRVKII